MQNPNESAALADIIREETDDGRILVRVLRDIAEGRIEDTKPNHRIAAVKELLRHVPDHSCASDDTDGVQPAANTTGEKFEKVSDEVSGSGLPSEATETTESKLDRPTQDTDSTVPDPENSHEEPVPVEPDPDQTVENTDPADPPSRRPRLTRSALRRLRRKKSTMDRGLLGNDLAGAQSEVDGVVSAGFP